MAPPHYLSRTHGQTRIEQRGRQSCAGARGPSLPLLVCLMLVALPCAPVWASPPAAVYGGAAHVFQIVPGPLDRVLNALATSAGVDVAADAAILAGRHSAGLSGTYSLEAAFARLLDAHGLRAVHQGNGSYTVVRSNTSATVLPDIVVKGEKSARPLSRTGASVDIFDADRIVSLPNATRVQDILQATVGVVDTGVGNDLPAIRGVDGSGPVRGAVGFLTGTRPRLNMSIDGRSLPYNELAFGPQSLWDIEQIEVFRGPQSHIQGRNAIAGAVVLTSKDPSFHWEGAVKAAAGNQHARQAAAMLSGPVGDSDLAFRLSVDRQQRRSFADLDAYAPVGDPRRIEATTARAKLLYEPRDLPGLTSRLTVGHYDGRAPQNEVLVPPPGIRSNRFDPRRPVQENRSTSGKWDVAWQFSETARLENTLVYTGFDNHRRTAHGLPHAEINGHEFHNEAVLHWGRSDDVVRGLAGARYFHAAQDEFVNIFRGSGFDDKVDTVSLFGEATYAVHPQLDLTLGARYERERRDRLGGSSAVAIDLHDTYTAFMPKLDIAWKPLPDHTYGLRAARGYSAGGAGVTFGRPIVSYTYDSEYVWNYEFYTRHRLDGGRLAFTTNVFYSNYTDMQLPYYLSRNATVVRNAEQVHTYGVELGARWLPVDALDVSGSVGLLKTRIARFADSGIEGNKLPRAPAYTVNVAAAYTFANKAVLSGNASYMDAYYSYYDNDPRGRISAHWIVNVQLDYPFSKHGRVAFYAQNLFDASNPIMITANDLSSPAVPRPRTFGVSVALSF